MTSRHDENEYELEKMRNKAFKLDRQLAEALIKLQNGGGGAAGGLSSHIHIDSQQQQHHVNGSRSSDKQSSSFGEKHVRELEAELEEQRELSASRLLEIEKINQEYVTAVRQIERLKADIKLIPDSVIHQSNEYKMLETKYSLIVSDNIKLKQALDETRGILEMSRITFQRQLEQMESDELAHQKHLGNEMMIIEEQLNQVRKDNEQLRIEYDRYMAANEQTGPINKEMRSLITTLQINNKLLKSDNVRAKKRYDEAQAEIDKLKKLNAQLRADLQHSSTNVETSSSSSNNNNNNANKDEASSSDATTTG